MRVMVGTTLETSKGMLVSRVVPPETTLETSKGMLVSRLFPARNNLVTQFISFFILNFFLRLKHAQNVVLFHLFLAQKEIKKEMNCVTKLLLGNARRNDAVTVHNATVTAYFAVFISGN